MTALTITPTNQACGLLALIVNYGKKYWIDKCHHGRKDQYNITPRVGVGQSDNLTKLKMKKINKAVTSTAEIHAGKSSILIPYIAATTPIAIASTPNNFIISFPPPFYSNYYI